jgi:crotonobetainyl-CoA:carnitine CoA-transferase CaiB-like acyl-CoA transferase
MTVEKGSPLTGIRVVEVSLGVSVVGAGLASSLPGALMRDLGADVVRVQSARRSTLDAGVEFARVWDRGKESAGQVRPGRSLIWPPRRTCSS